MLRRPLLAASLLALAAPVAAADVPPGAPPAELARIIDEGQQHSQVMVTAEHLADVIGPRLTNSPAMRQAEAWTQAKFTEWGLKQVHKEPFEFGRGWSIVNSSVRMLTPRPVQLTAIPIAWTPGTGGAISGPVTVAPIRRAADFARWRGRLAGKIVLVTPPDTGSEPTQPAFRRYTDEELSRTDVYKPPVYDPAAASRGARRIEFARQLDAFLKSEGALAYAAKSRTDGKLVFGEGYLFQTGGSPQIPAVEIAAEDYRRLARLLKAGVTPTLEINTEVRYDDSDRNAYDVIAEIPGSDARAGYVMAGAHLDSWVAGDGAADNGAGSAMVMEAARILAVSGARPRRTIRFALWAGEEQGLLGSQAYVAHHLATRGSPSDPKLAGMALYAGWAARWPVTKLAGWGDLSGYFNLDNGSGRIRGIYAENDPAVVPIFREWLKPFTSWGVSQVSIQRTGSTDHVFFQSVGVPGFQFIQDPLDYGARVHHSSIDTFDHLKADDMRQAATVLAAFLLDAADAPQALPRPPFPTEPNAVDPFAYDEEE